LLIDINDLNNFYQSGTDWHRYCSIQEFTKNVTPERNNEMPDRMPRGNRNILDYLLYALAGSVILTMSYSVLLWLQF